MDKEIYREALIDLFENPTNRGEMEKPDFEGYKVNNLCGDEVRFQFKVKSEKSKVIETALFSGDGCLLSQVSASLLAQNLEGKNLEQARKIGQNDILRMVGISPTPARMKCALLSLEVLKEAVTYGSKSKS